MFKENYPIILVRYFVYVYLLSIVFLSFYTNAEVPFFSPPSHILFALILFFTTVLYFGYINLYLNLSLKVPVFILLPYLYFFVVYAIKYLFQIEVNSLIVYGFIPTLVFYLILPIFNDKVSDVSIFFAKFVIVASFFVSALEMYQVIFLGFENFELYNKVNSHYYTNKIEGGIFSNRPYGLTGNFSLNAAIYIIAAQYIIYASSLKNIEIFSRDNYIYFFIVILGVLLAQSGTGYFLLFVFFSIHAFKIYSFAYQLILLPISVFIVITFGVFFEIQKISPEYFFHNIVILYDYYLKLSDYAFLDILFGQVSFSSIDTFFTFLVSEVGLVGLILYLFFFVNIFLNSNSQGKIFVMMIFLASFRYPVIVNQVGQIFMSFYLYSLYGKHKVLVR